MTIFVTQNKHIFECGQLFPLLFNELTIGLGEFSRLRSLPLIRLKLDDQLRRIELLILGSSAHPSGILHLHIKSLLAHLQTSLGFAILIVEQQHIGELHLDCDEMRQRYIFAFCVGLRVLKVRIEGEASQAVHGLV